MNTFKEIVEKLNLNNKRSYKETILTEIFNNRLENKRYMEFLEWIKLCHDDRQFYTTSKSYKKYIDKRQKDSSEELKLFTENYLDNLRLYSEFQDLSPFQQMDQLLELMNKRTLSGHEAKNSILEFLIENPEMEYFIFACMDKKSSTGLNKSTINKVIPGFIEVFEVALAKSFEIERVDLENEKWFLSRKLDGIRCIIEINLLKNTIIAKTRTGNEIKTLSKLNNILLDFFQSKSDKLLEKSNIWYLDGEICLDTSIGGDDFAGIHKQYNKSNHTIENPYYWMFDFLTEKEFKSKTSTRDLEKRLDFLENVYDDLNTELTKVSEILEQVEIKDLKEISDACEKARLEDREGVIVRKNEKYKGKRSFDILKVKNFIEDEFIVIGLEESTKRMLNDSGIMVEMPCIGKLIIEYKGNKVGVGSGLSDKQKLDYYNDSSLILNKEITVQYGGESVDFKTRLVSLRWPTLKCVHTEGKRNN